MPRRSPKLTHLRSAKFTRPCIGTARAQQGKALSSPPTAGDWVTFGGRTRAHSPERRRTVGQGVCKSVLSAWILYALFVT